MERVDILIPMDFSDCALGALRLGKHIAAKANVRLLFLTVRNSPLVTLEPLTGTVMAPVYESQVDDVDERYHELTIAEDIQELPFEIIKMTGGFFDAIEACLDSTNVDLIITGTNEEHGIGDYIFGSHSSELVKKAKIPVLVLPVQNKLFDIKRIGVAVNFEEKNDYSKFSAARDIALLFGAKVFILFATKDENHLYTHDDDKLSLSRYFHSCDYSFFTIKNNKNTIESLEHAIDQLGIDLLFMHPKNHNGLDGLFQTSKTRTMALSARIPLLTVHE